MNARSTISRCPPKATPAGDDHGSRSHRSERFRRLPIAAAVAAALTVPAAQAAFIDYVGPNGGFWDTPTNWTPVTPGNNPADDVRLGAMDTTFRMNMVNIRSFNGTGTLGLTGGILNVSAASSTGGFNMSGGTLGGSGTVTVSGLATLAGGTQAGTGTTQFNGNVAISGNGERTLSGGRIMNTTAVTNWGGNTTSGGNSLNILDDATINNSGTWNDSNAFRSALGFAFGNNVGTRIFNNSIGGTYNKTGSADTDLLVAFNNTGTVNVDAGRLNLIHRSDSTSSGTFNIAAGSTLSFGRGGNTGGDVTLGIATLNNATFGGTGTLLIDANRDGLTDVRMVGNMSHAGTLAIANGTLQVDNRFNAAAYNQTGGQLAGPGTVTISGLATLTGGEQAGTGISQFNGNVAISGNGERTLSGGRIMNTTAVTNWGGNTTSGGNSLNILDDATINNSGTWNDSNAFRSALGFAFGNNVGTRIFNNSIGGTYNKTGSADTDLLVAFNNTGTVNVDAGRLNLIHRSDSTSSGTFNIAAGSTLSFGRGGNTGGDVTLGIATLNNATFGGTGTLLIDANRDGLTDVRMVGNMSHAGTLAIANGTLQVDNRFNAAAYNQTGGQLAGPGTVTISGLATLTGGEQAGTGVSQFNGNVAISGNGERTLSGGRIMNTTAVTNWGGNTTSGVTVSTSSTTPPSTTAGPGTTATHFVPPSVSPSATTSARESSTTRSAAPTTRPAAPTPISSSPSTTPVRSTSMPVV